VRVFIRRERERGCFGTFVAMFFLIMDMLPSIICCRHNDRVSMTFCIYTQAHAHTHTRIHTHTKSLSLSPSLLLSFSLSLYLTLSLSLILSFFPFHLSWLVKSFSVLVFFSEIVLFLSSFLTLNASDVTCPFNTVHFQSYTLPHVYWCLRMATYCFY